MLVDLKNAIIEDIKECQARMESLKDITGAYELYFGKKIGLETALAYIEIAIVESNKN